jgi:hypothetical protein
MNAELSISNAENAEPETRSEAPACAHPASPCGRNGKDGSGSEAPASTQSASPDSAAAAAPAAPRPFSIGDAPLSSIAPPGAGTEESAIASAARAATPRERPEPDNPNRHRSNIARLPPEIREIINQALREGEEYRVIIARVQHLVGNYHGVYPSNLSSWFRTGYRDWLREKTHLENTIAQNDAALTRLCRLKSETGADLSDLLETFLASTLQRSLKEFDPASLDALLAEKPAEIFRLIACLNGLIAAKSKHKTAEVARVRCQVEVAEKAQSAKEQPVPVRNLWEAAMLRKSYGTPFEQVMRASKGASSGKRRKKRRSVSKTGPKDDAA